MDNDKRELFTKCMMSADSSLQMYCNLATTLLHEADIPEDDERHKMVEQSIDFMCERIGFLMDVLSDQFNVSKEEFEAASAESDRRLALLQNKGSSEVH